MRLELSLLARARQGDGAALEALVREYSARVYRLAFGITRNEAGAEEVVQDVFLTVAGDRTFLLADWSQDPECDLLSDETRRQVSRAIDDLPERYRAVLVLRDVEELSNEQVAEGMGESVASVKSRLHRARMALREHLTRAPELELSECILYLTALLADQPRAIDRYIDYFGGAPHRGSELVQPA